MQLTRHLASSADSVFFPLYDNLKIGEFRRSQPTNVLTNVLEIMKRDVSNICRLKDRMMRHVFGIRIGYTTNDPQKRYAASLIGPCISENYVLGYRTGLRRHKAESSLLLRDYMRVTGARRLTRKIGTTANVLSNAIWRVSSRYIGSRSRGEPHTHDEACPRCRGVAEVLDIEMNVLKNDAYSVIIPIDIKGLVSANGDLSVTDAYQRVLGCLKSRSVDIGGVLSRHSSINGSLCSFLNGQPLHPAFHQRLAHGAQLHLHRLPLIVSYIRINSSSEERGGSCEECCSLGRKHPPLLSITLTLSGLLIFFNFIFDLRFGSYTVSQLFYRSLYVLCGFGLFMCGVYSLLISWISGNPL